MANLNCSVPNCSYNQNNLCSLNSINVSGTNATNCKNTCCSSFVQQEEGACTNSSSNASPVTDIGCKAENCEYNGNCQCHAESISVGGGMASSQGDTCCLTFKSK